MGGLSALQRDDDLASGVSGFEISDGFASILHRVGTVDDWGEFPCFSKIFQVLQEVCILLVAGRVERIRGRLVIRL
jgi:hypothetical protein